MTGLFKRDGSAGQCKVIHRQRAGVSSHFLNSLIYIGSGKLAAQWTEKEHDFGTRHAKSPNFLREDVEISVIHDWPF
jgi:hypothetical protein